MAERTLLLCYDGSDDAKHAIGEAAALLAPRHALVLSVWQNIQTMSTLAWAPGPVPILDEVFEAARQGAERIAEEGAGLAREAGFEAEPFAVQSGGPIWDAIVTTAKEHDVAAIVMGSRGLSRVRSVLMGSVSNGVVQNATRPVLVTRPEAD